MTVAEAKGGTGRAGGSSSTSYGTLLAMQRRAVLLQRLATYAEQRGKSEERLEKLRDFCSLVGLPCCFTPLRLPSLSLSCSFIFLKTPPPGFRPEPRPPGSLPAFESPCESPRPVLCPLSSSCPARCPPMCIAARRALTPTILSNKPPP